MYKYDFICTYKLIDEEFRDMLYRQQLLEAFDLVSFDANIMREKQENIYEQIKDNKDFKQIFQAIKNKYSICESDSVAFSILFSYDYFNLFHRYLIDYFMNGILNKLNHKKLLDEIDKTKSKEKENEKEKEK